MNELAQNGILILFIIILSGCGRVTDWGKQAFYQGSPFIEDIEIPTRYVQQIVIHDQVRTEAKFVALWTSAEPVLDTYVSFYVRRYGLSEKEAKNLANEKKKEYQGKIIFYVLSLYNVPLDGPYSEWAISLAYDTCLLQPASVNRIELSPEYKVFFGNQLTLFKDAYKVVFNVSDTASISSDLILKLYFRSIEKEAILVWNQLECLCVAQGNVRNMCMISQSTQEKLV